VSNTSKRRAGQRTSGSHGPSERRSGAVGGFAGTAAVAALAAAVHTVVPSVPFPPLSISQVLVRTTSGGVDSFFIDRLGHWAQRLAVAGTCILFLASGLALGLLIPVLRRRMHAYAAGALSVLPLWVVSFALYVAMPQSVGRWVFAAATFPVFVTGGVLGGRVFRRLRVSTEGAPATGSQAVGYRRPTDPSRRVVLRAAWWGGLGMLLGAANLGRLVRPGKDPGTEGLRLAHLMVEPMPPRSPGDAAFAQIPGLTPEVTSIAAHYVVDEEIIDPSIDATAWRLAVGGLVVHPLRLTYAQLKALPAVERHQTLECVSNKVAGHLISTAKWIGIPLLEILDRAGVESEAVEVVFEAAGGYSDSLSIDQAMDESTLIAIGMNDHVLPRSHGFPARLLSIGTYGMKNPKWLTGIQVVNRPYAGFWEQRGWSKPAVVRTSSRIDVPVDESQISRSATVAGIAFAGDRGISKVEVSTDGGKSWAPAQLETALGAYTWRRWLYRWTPSARGRWELLVRATDGLGHLQSPQIADPFPSGSSGYDSIDVNH
jgi:DMSO/TMAO reductase YedYZ molybdopterin-dependent catalytic subunit